MALKRLKLFLGRCPNCSAKLDDSVHGFEKKYLHCPNGDYCTYDIYAKEMRER
jgi:hypothetical protein